MIYDYLCPKCGTSYELFSPIEDRHSQICHFCDEPLVKKITVGVPHIFKPYDDWAMDWPPVRIEGEKQKKQELEKRGLQPKC